MDNDPMTRDHEQIVDALEQTWTSTSAVLHQCSEANWSSPTACPGWTVKDQLAHMVWSARLLVGKTPPDIDLPELPHVTNPVKAYMELDVEARRPRPAVDVLDEFDETSTAAINDLRHQLPDGFEEPFPGPMGSMLTRDYYLPISLFDQWTHGQDIRAALDTPGDLDTPAARASFEWIVDRSTTDLEPVEFNLTGPGAATVRSREGDPVCIITIEALDLLTLATGRDRPVANPEVEGARNLAEQIFERFPLTP